MIRMIKIKVYNYVIKMTIILRENLKNKNNEKMIKE